MIYVAKQRISKNILEGTEITINDKGKIEEYQNFCNIYDEIMIEELIKFCPGLFDKEEESKFKVGDYAVFESYEGIIRYIKITDILEQVNFVTRYNGYSEEDLRKPTRKEINTYFR